MQVAGAGVATMLSNTISLIYFLVILIRVRKETILTINPKRFSMEKKVSWGSLSVGFPAAIAVLLVSVSISVLNGLLLTYENGNILSASYGIVAKCGTIALHISIGIAQGVMPLIGYNYGAKNYKRVHAVCRLSFIILLIFSVVFLIVVQIIPGPIMRIFTPDAATIEVGAVFMRCWSWCVIGMSLFNMYNSIFQAVGRWKTSLFLSVLRLGIIFVVLAFVLNAIFGVNGLMWVQAVTDTLSCIIAIILYIQFKHSISKEIHSVQSEIEKTDNCIITISRQFGSGGRTVGKEVAAKLGLPCYDSELIEKIAEESGLAKEYVEQYGEYAVSESLYENVMAGRNADGQSLTDKMWLAQKKVVIELAKKGSCVIVGRCADYILKDIADCIKVFICASDEWRAERIVKEYGERELPPVERLHDKDNKRKAYYELYTGTEWGVADNYTMCLDTSKIGIDAFVEMITELYNEHITQNNSGENTANSAEKAEA